MLTIADYLKGNPYPGRGVMLGLTPNGQEAVLAYFIMGRSENSRNRVFVEEGCDLRTAAQDPAKLGDPALIIYRPLRVYANHTIITNGDQTDTVFAALSRQVSFEEALRTRGYEPDAPHFTPRVSGLLSIAEGRLQYKLSLIKKGSEQDTLRFFYEYAEAQPGEAHLLHTYLGDGSPLPSFAGDPIRVPTRDDLAAFTQELWAALDADNRVALHVRYIDLKDYQVIHSRTLDRFHN